MTVDPDDGALSFAFGAGHHAEDVDATLERLFELVRAGRAERERRVALVLDEFQEIVELDPQLPKLLRSVFQEQPEVAHFYLGSKRHMMERIFNDANEPFWRSAKQIELGVIAAEPFAAFIARAVRATTSTRRRADGVDEVLRVTGGHPYATQELCYFLWEETPARRDGRRRASSTRRSTACCAPSTRTSASCGTARRPTSSCVLQALAREPGRPFSADYRRRHALPRGVHRRRRRSRRSRATSWSAATRPGVGSPSRSSPSGSARTCSDRGARATFPAVTGLSLAWALRTDVGPVRGNNEDTVYASPRIAAVADGVGGAAAGEVASRAAIDALVHLDRCRLDGPLEDALAAAIATGNERIGFIAECRPQTAGMSTTLTAVALGDERYVLANSATRGRTCCATAPSPG